jgi:hypothetical protein
MTDNGDASPENGSGLTAFQLEVAQLFFEMPASTGFLLAGGAALLAHRLTDRPTHDLDFFTAPRRGDVPAARDEFERVVRERSWQVVRIQDAATFCRLLIRSGSEELLVDLAVDSPPGHPGAITIAGPTFEAAELAGRKVIALFDRAEARDFVDVYLLARHFSKEVLLTRAAEIDAGFSIRIFADMLATLARFRDADLPIPNEQIVALRTFFADWRTALSD